MPTARTRQRSTLRADDSHREKMLGVAREILRREGISGVTSGRLAAAAGIAQSGFYRFFPSVDACIQEVAERVGQEVRRGIAEQRRAAQGGVPPHRLVAHMEAVLRFADEDRALAELLIKRRHDPSQLGVVARQVIDQMRIDLAEDLRLAALHRGAPELPFETYDRLADIMQAATFGAIERIVAGRDRDVRALAEVVARMVKSLISMTSPPR